MGADGMFRKVFGRKGLSETFATRSYAGDTLHPALKAELQRLEFYSRGFGQRAVRYVTTGDDEALLADMAPLARGNLVGSSAYQQVKPSLHDMTGATNLAVASGEIAPGPQLPRLLRLRIAASQIQGPRGKSLTTRELTMLGMSAMLFGGLSKLTVNYKYQWDKAIPLAVVLDHFRAAGGDAADVFDSMLRYDHMGYVEAGGWSASDTCSNLIRTCPSALAEAMHRAEPRKRVIGLKMIEHHAANDVPEIEALLVAMLSKPFTKDDRALVISALARLDPAQLLGVLERGLPTGDADARHALVEVAGRASTPAILACLAERAKVEKTARVQAAIAAVLEVQTADPATSESADEGDSAAYLSVTGETIRIPARTEIGSDAIPAPSEATRAAFAEAMVAIEAQRCIAAEAYRQRYGSDEAKVAQFYGAFTPEETAAAFATLTEAAPIPNREPGAQYIHRAESLTREVRGQAAGQKWLRQVLGAMPVPAALRVLKATRHDDMLALIGLGSAYRPEHLFGPDLLRDWLAAGGIEMRHLVGDAELRRVLAQGNSSYDIDRAINAVAALPADAVWPWLAENMAVFDEAFGLRPATLTLPLNQAMRALAMLPATPQRYLPRLVEIAVAEKRPLRLLAMALLREAKDLPQRIEALLDDKRQPVRINAAGWLADIRSVASEPALRKRLKKESSDPVRAALIIALQRLGADLADVIGPASLIAEAEKANAKTPPALPAWLVKSGLPVVRFRDGLTVPQAVVEYWMALAIRLKDPGAHGQFGIYLDQLEPADARALSNWTLESWISFDTFSATHEEATAWAKSVFHGHYASYAGRYVTGAQLPPDAQAQLIASLARQKMGALVNSGSDTKGLLALACRADPVWAAGRVRWFLKKHGRRSNQAMALLEALAGTGAPAALQVVIAASTRLKQKSTQARAAEIAQRYADDRGWSVDELADRTVPSAGFDDDGTLDLPCGEDAKAYVARLDATLAIHLFNPDGKPIKALPAGDDDNTRESKKAFTAAKKELTQIVTLQGERLFEAMCVERRWPVADWRLAFHQHPVMRRLIERLVWQGLDAEGQPLGLFRPTQEGDFTDADDNDVAIDDFAAVRLAHGALVDADSCKAWTAHLKDYEVKPFLAQFDTLRSPLTPEQAEAEAVTDRQGWVADSLTFRGAAEKRGYQRVMRDSGGCHEYVKTFPSHGITATIWHTGSYAVDENLPLALKELKITKSGHRGPYRLKDVPPVMLAECWADYHAVAAKGAFDPEWEKISPW